MICIQVMGDIVAPSDIAAWTGHDLRTWVVFGNVNGLTVEGNGKIDGRGGVWWPQANKLVERPSVSPLLYTYINFLFKSRKL